MVITRRFFSAILVVSGALAVCVAPGDTSAQAVGTLSGRITADSGGGAIGYAGIRIPELDRVGRADSSGRFRLEQLPPGGYVIIAEAPGFRARRALVTLRGGEEITQDFVLSRSAQVLAMVDVRAKAPPRVTPKMADFERRRQRGNGKFVTRAELARTPGRQLEEVLRTTTSGAQFIKTPTGQTWLISTRHSATNLALLRSGNTVNNRNTVCYVQVVLDGVIVSSTTAPRAPRIHGGGEAAGGRAGITDPQTQVQDGDDPIDLNLFITDQFEAVEFYADATTTPMQYRTGAAVCGTLVLWTRDR